MTGSPTHERRAASCPPFSFTGLAYAVIGICALFLTPARCAPFRVVFRRVSGYYAATGAGRLVLMAFPAFPEPHAFSSWNAEEFAAFRCCKR